MLVLFATAIFFLSVKHAFHLFIYYRWKSEKSLSSLTSRPIISDSTRYRRSLSSLLFQCSTPDVLLQYINATTFDSRYFLLEINGFTFDTRRSFASNKRIKYQRRSNLSLLNWKAAIRINRINRCCKTCIRVQRIRNVSNWQTPTTVVALRKAILAANRIT